MTQKLLKKLWLRVIVTVMTTAFTGSVWAQTTYALQQVTSVEAGGLYVFEQDGYVMNNKCTNSALQTTDTYETTGLTGEETYVWTLESATDGYYMKNVNGTGKFPYLNNASSTNVSFGNNANSVWAFNFQDDNTVLIQNTTNSNRFLGYTNSTSYAYKAYAIANLNGSYPHAIKVYQLVEEGGSGDQALATSITISDKGITNTNIYEGTDAGRLIATVIGADGNVLEEGVVWSGDNDEVATIGAETGIVTLVGAGTVTFTASYAGVENAYKPSSKTYTMTVTNSDPNAPGTEAKPYTVAEARAAIDAGANVTGVYATGIVSKIVTAFNPSYGNISYNISVDGTEEADQLQAYRGKSYKGEKFTSENDIQVGDVVVIYGNLKKYNNTYEFEQDNQLVSLQRPVVTTPCIDVAETEVSVPAEGKEGTIVVDYLNITNVAAEVFFCDADGNAATYDWIVAEINSQNNNVDYIIDANTSSDARTAYFKVYALDDDANDVYSDLVTITQAPGLVIDYATVPFAYNGGKSNLPTGFTQNGLGNDYKSAPYLKFDSTGDELVVKIDKAAAMLFFDIKGNSFSGGTFTVQTSADGTAYAELSSYTNLDDTQTEALKLDADVRYIKWVYTEKSNGNVGLGNIKVVDWIDEVTVGEAGYATYVAKHNESFPEGVEAYKAAVNGQYVTLTAVTAVPKGTPVVLKGEGTFTLIPTIADNLSDVTGNELKASDGTVEGNGSIYVLAQPAGEKVGFYAVKKGTKVAEGKAYLEVVSTTGVKAFYFEGDDATSLNEELRMKNEESKGEEIYNLAGQRISKMQKGINIVGGKKVLR